MFMRVNATCAHQARLPRSPVFGGRGEPVVSRVQIEGSQPTLSAALATCGVSSESYAFQACSIDHSDISPL
jgi:hypothetical protein